MKILPSCPNCGVPLAVPKTRTDRLLAFTIQVLVLAVVPMIVLTATFHGAEIAALVFSAWFIVLSAVILWSAQRNDRLG